MSGEADERLPVGPRGEQGAQGVQGERGQRGLSSRTARAIAVLFLINALGIAGNLLWTGRAVNESAAAQRQQQAAQQRQAAQQAAAQHAEAAAFKQRLCASFGQLAELRPPAGSPLDNPSRAYLQDQHAVLVGIGKDVGCGR